MWIILVRINLANDRSWINLESWEWIFYRFTPGRSLFMMMSLHLNFNLSKSLLFLIPFLVSTWLSSVSDCMKEVAWMEVQFGTTGYQQGNSRVSSHKLIHFPLEENACVDHSGNEEGRCVACSWFLQLDHHFAEVGLCFLSSLGSSTSISCALWCIPPKAKERVPIHTGACWLQWHYLPLILGIPFCLIIFELLLPFFLPSCVPTALLQRELQVWRRQKDNSRALSRRKIFRISS